MQLHTTGTIPSKTVQPSDQLKLIHVFIKKIIDALGKQVEDAKYWKEMSDHWQQSNHHWRESYAELKGWEKLSSKDKQKEVGTKPLEGKILRLSIKKDNSK